MKEFQVGDVVEIVKLDVLGLDKKYGFKVGQQLTAVRVSPEYNVEVYCEQEDNYWFFFSHQLKLVSRGAK